MLTSPDTTLTNALQFDLNDLEANRAGALSARQQAGLQAAIQKENKDFTFGMTLLALPGIFVCGACFFLFNIPVIIGSVNFLPEILAVVGGIIGLGVLWAAFQGWRNTRGGRQIAQAITGPLSLLGDEQRQRPRFYIIIGEERFRVPWRMYEGLQLYERIGEAHTLYYVPGMRYVLSMEPA